MYMGSLYIWEDIDMYVSYMVLQLVKDSPSNAGDASSIPGLESSPGVGNGNPLQYSCLENSMDKGAWQAIAHGVPKSQTQPSMSMHMCVCVCVCVCISILFHI